MRPSVGSQAKSESPSGCGGMGFPASPGVWGFPPSPTRRCHDRRCPSGSGWGEAPARACLRAARCGRSRRGHAGGGSHRPLARETSVGVRSALSNGYARGRKIPGDVGRESEAKPSAAELEAKASTTRRRSRSRRRVSRPTENKPGSGRKPGVGWRLRSSRAKARGASKRASACSGCSVTWGSVDSQVVLADCLYCRSRRAAFGPLPPLTKAREGLAGRRSAP
jgi:hypothetical protein